MPSRTYINTPPPLQFRSALKGSAKPMWMVRGVPAIEKGINQGYELLDNN